MQTNLKEFIELKSLLENEHKKLKRDTDFSSLTKRLFEIPTFKTLIFEHFGSIGYKEVEIELTCGDYSRVEYDLKEFIQLVERKIQIYDKKN